MRTGTLIELTTRGGTMVEADWQAIAARLAQAFPEAIVLDAAANRGGLALAMPPAADADAQDETPEGVACLMYLLTSRQTGGTVGDNVSALVQGHWDARSRLREWGMDVRDIAGREHASPYLWVAYHNRQLSGLFAASPWASQPRSSGRWVRALASLPGAIANVSFCCGGQTKAVLIPLHLVCPPADEVTQ
ncbi:MAG: hypothetical protein H7Y60_09150 [Rhodospirillaceae bacterium]|nr:hypothetical protein [Rhodospirillales bacterium]